MFWSYSQLLTSRTVGMRNDWASDIHLLYIGVFTGRIFGKYLFRIRLSQHALIIFFSPPNKVFICSLSYVTATILQILSNHYLLTILTWHAVWPGILMTSWNKLRSASLSQVRAWERSGRGLLHYPFYISTLQYETHQVCSISNSERSLTVINVFCWPQRLNLQYLSKVCVIEVSL
jgi:hypothetical protein